MGTSTINNSCVRCHTEYRYYGIRRKVFYINNYGPICECCYKKGIKIVLYEKGTMDIK